MQLQLINNSSEILKEMKAFIDIKSLNLKVLHHSEELVLPVLMLDIYDLNPIYRSNLLVNQFSMVLHLEFNFFNPRCSQWEPIIEKFGVHLEHVVTHKDSGDESLMVIENLDEAGLDHLNVNISSQFLTSLKEIVSLNQKEKEKIEKNEIEDQKIEVSPFVVENLTLEDIRLISVEEKHENNKEMIDS